MLVERGHVVVGTDIRPVTLPGVEFHLVPAAADPAFVPALRRIAAARAVNLLIPTVSEELPVLAADRARWGQARLALCDYAAVSLANDKYLTCAHLTSARVRTPRYALPSWRRSADEVAWQTGWPCLSKPRIGRGGRGVVLYHKEDDRALAALDDQSILQEFVPGIEYAPNVYLGCDGSEAAIVLEKTALKDGLVGNAASVRRVEAPDVAALALAAGRALGLTGPLDVDIRRRADGTPVVLEVNARFGANSTHAPEILDALLADYAIAPIRVAHPRGIS
jgi:carbamoylphosphate synthase large subunit